MTSFLIIVAAMCIATWFYISRPLIGASGSESSMNEEVNRLRKQLVQLSELAKAGTLSAESYEESKQAVERKIVDAVMNAPSAPKGTRSWKLAAGLGVFIVAIVAGGYVLLGTPVGLGGSGGAMPGAEAAAGGAPADGQHPTTPEQVAALTEKLTARLKQNPDDAEGWYMLARTYAVLNRYPEAASAYKRLIELKPNEAPLYADYADALGMANNRSLDGEPTKALEQAIKLDPNNLKALALLGTGAFNRRDFTTAIKYWEKVVKIGPPENEIVQQMAPSIAEAQQMAGLKPAAGAAAPLGNAAATGAPAKAVSALTGISGTVVLTPALAKQASPDDTLFVFARAANGPRMPLSILRKKVKDLPFAFTLDDSQSMSPEMKLSNFPQVVISARVSKSGEAAPKPGDLQGTSAPIALGSQGVKIEINDTVK